MLGCKGDGWTVGRIVNASSSTNDGGFSKSVNWPLHTVKSWISFFCTDFTKLSITFDEWSKHQWDLSKWVSVESHRTP